MANTITLTRQDLYEKVWTTPMQTLAKEFNLSDVGLAKICKKHDIPKPGKGYWAKLANGKRTEKRPLPNSQNNPDITINISGIYHEIFRNHNISPEKVAKIKEQFKVPEILKDPHPLIQRTIKLLKENKNTYYRCLEVLDIDVHPSEMARALRFMDTFIKIMEGRGHTIKIGKRWGEYKQYQTEVIIKNINNPIRLYTYYNKMTFGLNEFAQKTKNWGDSKAISLEDKLYDIVLHILLLAREDLKRVIQHRIEENEKKRLEAIRLEQERLRQEEEKRIKELEEWVMRWKKSRDIQAFLQHVIQCITKKHGGYDENSDLGQWVKWAYGYAEEIDPVKF